MKDNAYDLKGFYNNIIKHHPLRFGHQFTVEFFTGGSSTTGMFNGNGDGTEPSHMFTYFVQATSIPKVEITAGKVAYLAAGFEVPSTVKYPDSWTVDIIIDQGLSQYNKLVSWQEAMSDLRTSQGRK